MIGVLAASEDSAVVEEFFELFKTPWEYCNGDADYDAVVSFDGHIPGSAPRLLVLYASFRSRVQGHSAVSSDAESFGATICATGTDTLPIYGHLERFESTIDRAPILRVGQDLAAYRVVRGGSVIVRVGYNLLHEVEHLLKAGQPTCHAACPSLEIHIGILRDQILAAGIPLLELPPSPPGVPFQVCLTHDVDFVGIRRHVFDHTMWGFLYRSTSGALLEWMRGRSSLGVLGERLLAAAKLPLVYLGLARDFWEPFDWYMEVEKEVPATYFLIPFKNRMGERVTGPNAHRRASKYDIDDINASVASLRSCGYEIGVHGIDAWHDVRQAVEERDRVAKLSPCSDVGIRMHWLLQDEETYRTLDAAGYTYDSTAGYNDTVGYRCGTTQVFRPFGSQRLVELPLHVQDGALFYPKYLALTEGAAWQLCERMWRDALRFGGVLTINWHDRSHGPERLWGGFYKKLLEALRDSGARFVTGAQATRWFGARRQIRFARSDKVPGAIELTKRGETDPIDPPLRVVIYRLGLSDGEEPADLSSEVLAWHGDAPLHLTVARSHITGSRAS